ncbi:NARE ribosyltransferase, partial [Nycticryphes semicollaris]|nr:NARE ribosyltransferase [Nycticryphes semicollaris]
MEHLVLGLVLLLAGTLAAGNPLIPRDLELIKKIRLDMATNSFDDQYLGCSRKMETELGKLNSTEFKNKDYKKAWIKATAEWRNRTGSVPKVRALRTEHAVALMAYTLESPLYEKFNAAVREAGRSHREYQDKFHFKVLHFLLTQAVSILWEAQPHRCYNVYRGVKNIRFIAWPKDLVRFGQFTSTSLQKEEAEEFGHDTFFSVYTCYGVPIQKYSYFSDENEVLIPPYETFEVTNITLNGKRAHIHLRSTGTFSRYNCEWLKEKRCQGKPCVFSAGRSIVGNTPLLWGLLLAATTLAASGGP